MKKIFLILIMILFMAPLMAQSITLTWVNSPSEGVTGYNLYRRNAQNLEFTKINAELIPHDPSGTGEYTDVTVNYIRLQYYVCRAVIVWDDPETGESGEVESADSNVAIARAYYPNPNPPTGLIKKSSTP